MITENLLDCVLRDLDSIRIGAYEPEPGFFQRRLDGYREDIMKISLEQAPTLEPEIVQLLALKLANYNTLMVDFKLLKEQIDDIKGEVLDELNLWGLEKAVIDDIPCTVVGGNSSSLDKVKFVQLGGSLKMLEEATVSKPKKKHLRIGKESD